MFEVHVLPDITRFGAQILSTILLPIIAIVPIYVTILIIKALRIYINKNS